MLELGLLHLLHSNVVDAAEAQISKENSSARSMPVPACAIMSVTSSRLNTVRDDCSCAKR